MIDVIIFKIRQKLPQCRLQGRVDRGRPRRRLVPEPGAECVDEDEEALPEAAADRITSWKRRASFSTCPRSASVHRLGTRVQEPTDGGSVLRLPGAIEAPVVRRWKGIKPDVEETGYVGRCHVARAGRCGAGRSTVERGERAGWRRTSGPSALRYRSDTTVQIAVLAIVALLIWAGTQLFDDDEESRSP